MGKHTWGRALAVAFVTLPLSVTFGIVGMVLQAQPIDAPPGEGHLRSSLRSRS